MNNIHTLVTEEFTRNVQGFTSDDDNLLTIEGLLGDDGSKTSEQVTLAINNNGLRSFSNWLM